MGCLKAVRNFIIIILVIVAFIHFGVFTYCNKQISSFLKNRSEKAMEKSEEILNFNNLDEEFKLLSSMNIIKFGRYAVFSHTVSSQKFIIIKPQKSDFLTQEELNSEEGQKKIENLFKDYKFLDMANVHFTGQGKMKGLNQEIPYKKLATEISNVPVKNLQGIIGVINYNDSNIIFISVNTTGKYSQIITNAFVESL